MSGAGAATRLIIASPVGNALEFHEILVHRYFRAILRAVAIDLTGSKLAPSYDMIATATLSLLALLIMRHRYRL